MPCEYSAVNLKEREATKRKQREDEKKAETARKKKAVLTALIALGFDLDLESAGSNRTLIIGTKEE